MAVLARRPLFPSARRSICVTNLRPIERLNTTPQTSVRVTSASRRVLVTRLVEPVTYAACMQYNLVALKPTRRFMHVSEIARIFSQAVDSQITVIIT